ncbi:MAG TPA: ABC transporter substrate-binding protein [Thermomicrobiales bacterium]|nr:ABC transporter substrate-binding protein [Thermomicrobiales bacterium]
MPVFEPDALEELLWRFRTGRISRRQFLTALGTGGVVLAGSAALAACGSSAPAVTPMPGSKAAGAGATAAPTAATGGGATAPAATTAAGGAGGKDTVVLSLSSDITSLDPHANVLRDGIKVFYHLFDNLGVRDYASNRVGQHLATEWKNTGDTTWDMTLRDDVKFVNGDKFTANTVKFNIERVINPATKSPQAGNWQAIDHIEVHDETHLTWVTKKPYPVFVERLQNLQFLAENVVKEKGDAWVAENCIGTGPYKLIKYDRGQQIAMERNDGYWGPKPAFKYGTFRIIPDISTQIAELLAGNVDIVPAFPLDQIDALEKSGRGKSFVQPILRTMFRGMDARGRSGANPFQDKAVRLAVNLACNVKGYANTLEKGGDFTPGCVSPLAFGFDKTVPMYDYDQAKAKQTLTDAGYKPDQDGVMAKDGKRLEFKLLTGPTTVPNNLQIQQAIVQDLQAVGIKAEIQNVGDSTAFVSTVTSNKTQFYQFDWGYYSVFDADGILWDMFHSDSPYAYFSTPELDKLLEDGRGTLDQQKRLEAYSKAQHLLHDEAAVLFMFAVHSIWGVSSKVDWQPRSDEIDRLFEAKPKA